MNLQKVEIGTQRHRELLAEAEQSVSPSAKERISFREIAETYNQLRIGEMIEWRRTRQRWYGTKDRIRALGLKDEDFHLYTTEIRKDIGGKSRVVELNVVLVRLTESKMTVPTRAAS